jgi:hypothetical protein
MGQPRGPPLDSHLGQVREDDHEFATFTAGYAAANRGDSARATSLLNQLAYVRSPPGKHPGGGCHRFVLFAGMSLSSLFRR